MIKDLLNKISEGYDLSVIESYELLNFIMSGKANNSEIAGLLLALKTKGESSNEIAGFAKSMRFNSLKVNTLKDAIDICGTGGDNSGTFNISTASAFVISSCGIPVAKHGNRSVSSKSGSTDVLAELGIDFNISPVNSIEEISSRNLTFLHAPSYHPALKNIMPVRQELGIKTIFNVLGPLTNPAATKRQVIGTFNDKVSSLMAEACKSLDMEKVCFICTENKFDEITLTGRIRILEFENENISEKYLAPEDLGLPLCKLQNIQGDNAEYNAKLIENIFRDKKRNDAYYVVAANSAMGIYVSGIEADLKKCVQLAEENIQNGNAFNKLEEMRAGVLN